MSGEPINGKFPITRSHVPRVLRLVALRDARAAQLVEFAVALPLLIVFVVGIFDFSGAFTLRQKLTNAARDAARVAAADPASDLGSALPASVIDAFQVVDNYLISNNLSDCGITEKKLAKAGLTWSVPLGSSSCPPAAGLATITINRGYYFPANAASQPALAPCTPVAPSASQTAVISTCVTIQYAYPWRFGRVASLLGANATLPATITATAIAMNEN